MLELITFQNNLLIKTVRTVLTEFKNGEVKTKICQKLKFIKLQKLVKSQMLGKTE